MADKRKGIKIAMIFGEKTEEQKRVAELMREVKELRKEL